MSTITTYCVDPYGVPIQDSKLEKFTYTFHNKLFPSDQQLVNNVVEHFSTMIEMTDYDKQFMRYSICNNADYELFTFMTNKANRAGEALRLAIKVDGLINASAEKLYLPTPEPNLTIQASYTNRSGNRSQISLSYEKALVSNLKEFCAFSISGFNKAQFFTSGREQFKLERTSYIPLVRGSFDLQSQQ